MSQRQTHTYALLPVSQAAFDEIRTKLRAAGYDHCIIQPIGDYQERVTLTGIALVVENKPDTKTPQ